MDPTQIFSPAWLDMKSAASVVLATWFFMKFVINPFINRVPALKELPIGFYLVGVSVALTCLGMFVFHTMDGMDFKTTVWQVIVAVLGSVGTNEASTGSLFQSVKNVVSPANGNPANSSPADSTNANGDSTVMRLIVLLAISSTIIFALGTAGGCTNAQVSQVQRINTEIAAATTQPVVQATEAVPIFGDYVKAGADFLASLMKLLNPVLDLLRPPSAAVARGE